MTRTGVAAILLAGGESRRMGTPKPLLDWGGRTLIEYQLEQLKPPADLLVVVLGHRADEVRPYVHRAGARAVINELYAEGRASSLRVGAAALPEDTEAVLVLNVDQPRPRSVIQRLLEEHRRATHLITVPSFAGRWGHPPVLAGSLLPELREVREASRGLRGLVERHRQDACEVPFDSDVVLLDINRPEEYDRARADYFQNSESHQVSR